MQEQEKTSFSTTEFSQLLDIPISTVNRWIQRGKLKAVKGITGHYAIPQMEYVRLLQEQEKINQQIEHMNEEIGETL